MVELGCSKEMEKKIGLPCLSTLCVCVFFFSSSLLENPSPAMVIYLFIYKMDRPDAQNGLPMKWKEILFFCL